MEQQSLVTGPGSMTPTSQSPEAIRRADLAMAAARGTSEKELVLRSDSEGLMLLGVPEECALLADVLRWQGSVLRDRGQTEEAEALYNRSLRVAQACDYLAGQSHAVNCLGALAQRRGELHRAGQLFKAAYRMAEGCGDMALAGMIQQNRGIVADIAGDTEAALAHYTDGLRSFEEAGDTRSMTLVLNNLGLLRFKLGEYAEARESYDRAVSLARTRGDLLSEGVIEENIADLELRRGDADAASESIARAVEIAVLRQDPMRRASALKLLATSLRLEGRPQDALDALRHAQALGEEADDPLLVAEMHFETGLALASTNDVDGAREALTAALELARRIGATALADSVATKLVEL